MEGVKRMLNRTALLSCALLVCDFALGQPSAASGRKMRKAAGRTLVSTAPWVSYNLDADRWVESVWINLGRLPHNLAVVRLDVDETGGVTGAHQALGAEVAAETTKRLLTRLEGELTFGPEQHGKRFWVAAPVEPRGKRLLIGDPYVLAPILLERSVRFDGEEGVPDRRVALSMRLQPDGLVKADLPGDLAAFQKEAILEAVGSFHYHPKLAGLPLPPVEMLVATHANATPVKRVQPMYPRRAADDGVEGYAILTFCISETGKTIGIELLDSSPPGVFNAVALRAVRKWEYQPRIVDGVPVRFCPVPVKLEFNL